jgi:hypothetical protein
MTKQIWKPTEQWTEEDHFDCALNIITNCVTEARKTEPQLNGIHMAYALLQAANMLSPDNDWPVFLHAVLSECVFMEHGE